jgi:serine/threonine-protein kinase RsbW
MSASLRDSIELRVPSRPEYVAVVRTLITDIARRVALSASAVEDLQVAASEACSNVVRHAYAETKDADPGILVRCSYTRGRLVIEVADEGRGLDDPHKPLRRNADSEGGFGLTLMRSLMDDVSLDSIPDQGTIVRMAKKIPNTA